MSVRYLKNTSPEDVDHYAIPTTAALRRLLREVLTADADLDAFCLDHFPLVHREFTQGMTGTAKLNLLLEHIPAKELLPPLREYSKKETAAPKLLISVRERRNRRRMIEKVRKFWIEGVLEKSLHGSVMMELEKKYRPDAVAYPWNTILEQPNSEPQPIPKGKKMIELFDENLGELLILGLPGAGKTTMLLDLCRDLLNRAEASESEPIPVVFHLSSWANKRSSIVEWLAEELLRRYDVPQKCGAAWLESGQILPLLDGFDEVNTAYRSDCIKAINSYQSNHNGSYLVVCSRTVEYDDLGQFLHIQRAVVLQPLTSEQVHEFIKAFSSLGDSAKLRLLRDSSINELCTSPLLLNITLQTKDIASINGELIDYSSANYRNKLIDLFIQASMRRRVTTRIYEFKRTIHHLSELARQMIGQEQGVFYLEELRPRVKTSKWREYLYRFVSFFLLEILILTTGKVVSVPIIRQLLTRFNFIQGPREERHWVLMFIYLAPLLMAFITAATDSFGPAKMLAPVDSLRWSWKAVLLGIQDTMRRGFQIAKWFVPASTVGIGIAMAIAPDYEFSLLKICLTCLAAMLCSMVAVILITLWIVPFYIISDGIVSERVPVRQKPNQGIMRSVYLAFALLIAYVSLEYAVYFMVFDGSKKHPIILLLIQIFLPAMMIWMLRPLGGRIVAYHFTTRIILAIRGILPFRLGRFLEFCTERMLLRKVGCGYIFIHHILMEYFASLSEQDIRRLVAEANSHTRVTSA